MAVKQSSKKGAFYTLAVFVFLAVVFSSLNFQGRETLAEKNSLVKAKASALSQFVLGLEADSQRALFIAGFRALLAAEDSTSYSFLNDSEAGLVEAIMNGTIEGAAAPLMSQSTFPSWLSRTSVRAREVGVELNFSVDSISVSQGTPWSVDFHANISYNATDSIAGFARRQGLSSSVSIIGLKDPLYHVLTSGKVIRTINLTPYEGNYASGPDTSSLVDHINGLYYANSTGPSFLMRLEGNLNDSTAGLGIESFVLLPDLQAQGLPVFERSAIDYVYFNSNSSPVIYAINNTFEDWLRIDDSHLDKYQVRDLAE